MHWTLIVGWLVAFAFVAISAVINALFLSSLGRTGLEAYLFATLSVVADVAKAVLPLLMLAAWRNGHRKAAGLGGVVLTALIGLSVMSGMGFAAMTRSTVTSAQEMTALELDMTTGAIRRSEQSLVAIGAVRPAGVIEADLASALGDRMWSLSQACTNVSSRVLRDYCSTVARLRAELGSAQAAHRIEEALREHRARLATLRERGASGSGDPQATAAAQLLGISSGSARLAMTIGLAVVIEIGAVVFVVIVAAAAVGNGASQAIEPAPTRKTRETTNTEAARLPLPPKSRQWLKRQQASKEQGNGKDGVHAAT